MIKRHAAAQMTTCEREPINTPGAIQPHGVLLALSEPELVIAEVSKNASEVFGRTAKQLLGTPLASWLSKAHLKKLLAYVNSERWTALQPISLRAGRSRRTKASPQPRWDVFVHRRNGMLLLEFEPARTPSNATFYYRFLRTALGRIHTSQTVIELCRSAVEAVREVTQFDRVMAYRFDREWNGEVIAEAKREDLAPYLSHHFPASDIPSQARAIFLSTWVRAIPDVHYKPVPMRSLPGRGKLDMGDSSLRAVSPIHIEYLKNMGTGATLTISLKTVDGLWGLIACHHESAKNIPYGGRLACELIGKCVSALMPSCQQKQDEHFHNQLREARADLSGRAEEFGSLREGLQRNPELLLRVVDAAGVALRVDDDQSWILIGKTPSRPQVQALARWLSKRMGDREIFSTNSLAHSYKGGSAIKATASGVLAISIPQTESDIIIWFRPEEAATKVWAGDPRKQVSKLPDGTIKIEPRQSFEDWKGQVSLLSRPWSSVERSSALALRANLITVDLRRQFKAAQQGLRVRDEFLSIASHELKTPLTSMRLQGAMAGRRMQGKETLNAQDLQKTASAVQKVNEGMERLIRLVDDMLDISRISTGNLNIRFGKDEIVSIAQGVTERMRVQFDNAGVRFNVHFGEPAEGQWDRLRIEQVLWNLLSNALRYGNGSPVSVQVGKEDDQAIIVVRDEGPGISVAEQSGIFRKFKRVGETHKAAGLGLGLHICKHIVERHAGSIDLHSVEGQGTTFKVSLPLSSLTGGNSSNPASAPKDAASSSSESRS